MPRILTNNELRDILAADYSPYTINKESLDRRKFNIETFNNLDRVNLQYRVKEKRILLYETLNGEEVYIQFPGKESAENPQMPLDFRPKVKLTNGEFAVDLSFGAIWDILDEVGKNHQAYLPYVAAIVFRLGYMHDYIKESVLAKSLLITIDDGTETLSTLLPDIALDWYRLNLSEDVWYTLNDRIGMIQLGNNCEISFEGFIKLVDLLFQNEDCKYYYKNVVLNGKTNYRFSNGRTNSSAANLLILNYLKGNVKLSSLLDSFQKSRGVPSFRKSDYSIVTDRIIINVDVESR